MPNQVKVGIGVIILDDNRVLLGHRAHDSQDTGGIYEPDSWTLPGGKQEFAETIIEGARRETKEETNLDVDDLVVIGASDDFGPDKHYVTIHVLARKHVGEVTVCEPDKIDEWRWFDLDHLPNNVYSPSENSLKCLKKWRENR